MVVEGSWCRVKCQFSGCGSPNGWASSHSGSCSQQVTYALETELFCVLNEKAGWALWSLNVWWVLQLKKSFIWANSVILQLFIEHPMMWQVLFQLLGRQWTERQKSLSSRSFPSYSGLDTQISKNTWCVTSVPQDSSKARKVWGTATAKRRLRRHDN